MREPILDAGINVVGGLELVEASLAVGVERLVFASTGGAIYGEVPVGKRANESTPPAPASPYAIHKLTFELLLGMYRRHRGLDTRILRYANVYGPRQDPHGEAGVIAIFLDRARAGQPLFVNARSAPGDGGCVRDYVFVSDVARMNVLALTGVVKEPVANVGTGSPTTTEELAKVIVEVSKSASKIEDRPSRAGDLEVSLLDPTLPERYLGKLVGLAEGLERTRASLG
jgi:UDP-glucose 4-epimerase